MKKIIFLLIVLKILGCSSPKGDITKEMKVNLISFTQKEISWETTHYNGEIIKQKRGNHTIIEYYTEETACPFFEAGVTINDKNVNLYYQDIKFVPVKCIGFFKLTFEIEFNQINNLKIIRLEPINNGISFF